MQIMVPMQLVKPDLCCYYLTCMLNTLLDIKTKNLNKYVYVNAFSSDALSINHIVVSIILVLGDAKQIYGKSLGNSKRMFCPLLIPIRSSHIVYFDSLKSD